VRVKEDDLLPGPFHLRLRVSERLRHAIRVSSPHLPACRCCLRYRAGDGKARLHAMMSLNIQVQRGVGAARQGQAAVVRKGNERRQKGLKAG